MEEKVNLPKSTKKVYYQIFRGISLTDIAVFLVFISFAILFAWAIPVQSLLRAILAIFFLFFGLIAVQKDKNELRIYEWFLRFCKHWLFGWWKADVLIKPEWIKTKNEAIVKIQHFNKNLFLGGIKIESINLQLLNEEQQLALIEGFSNLLRSITIPCKIIKTNVKHDFSEQNIWFVKKQNEQKEKINQELINLQIEQLNTIETESQLTTSAVYLIWAAKNESQSLSQLNTISNLVAFIYLQINILDNEAITQMWTEFNFSSNWVEPKASKFQNKKDPRSGFIWTINSLPKQINYFWLNHLFNTNNVNVCININPINKIKATKQLDNALNKIKTNANNYANTPSKKEEAEQYLAAFLRQQESVINDNDVLKEIAIFIIGYGDEKNNKVSKRELNDLAIINGWRYDKLVHLQQQALLACFSWNNLIPKTSCIEMTCDTFATSFPIPDFPLKDEQGFLFAETISGKPVMWDLFKKTPQRVNQNMLILGESGSGKSFSIKKIILNLVYRDTKVFILDPEREYELLTKNLLGQWLDTSGNKGNTINPLEIYKLSEDEDNADAFDNQLELIDAFFTLLFPSLLENDQLQTLLIELVKEIYLVHKILPSTDCNSIDSSSWPTFDNLYELICQKINQEKVLNKVMLLESLKSKLTALTKGTYAKYWNGHTKLKINNQNLTCFDLQALTSTGNQKITNVQMLLILRLLSKQLIANKIANQTSKIEHKIAIIVDEAHLLANENNPIALDFLFHTMKRIRKYGGSLIIITQNINDFTGSESIKKHFTGIINNCTYWLIGGMQANDVLELDKMYKQSGGLSKAIRNYIATASKGKFWFKISKQEQLPIQILQLDAEVALVGN